LNPVRLVQYILILLACCLPVLAQTASLRGQITDESGAVIPGAKVTLRGPAGLIKTATAGNDGSYSFVGLATGDYMIQAAAPDLTMPQPVKVSLRGAGQVFNLQLKVAATAQQMTVQDSPPPAVSADAANNASALVLRGEDLQALSDDPDDLAADLQALAGPAAGPNGGSIFIDGFSGGQLPPKDSIREIRINQNPFSPEYDKLGYGRIEIFTKPGTDKFRGTASYNFGDDFWNTRNAYTARKAPFLLKEYGGSLSGPLDKKASFTLDVQRHSIDNGAMINGITLDPQTLAVINPYTDVFRVPQRRIIVTPRVDYQLTPDNTLTFRYNFTRADIQDSGIGSFNLVSRGYHIQTTAHTAQVSETAVLGAHVINETRFQFYRTEASTIANSFSPAIQVLGSFNSGGAQVGHAFSTENDYEIQNYTSVLHGAHSMRFGVRVRGAMVDDTSPTNFGGSFLFSGNTGISSIEQYRLTLTGQQMGLSPAQIRAMGGGASQFTITAGNPFLSASQWDAGVFAGDDWRARPNLTFSFGVRYEMQTNISDHRDFAPRVGMAWAPGATGKGGAKAQTVLRAGFGIFYDRFDLQNTLTARRYNGIVEQQYVVTNPDFFPTVPPLAALGAVEAPQTIQEVSRNLRTPYIMQSAVGVERQLPRNTTLAVTYANSHGLHTLRSADINAPLPGTGLYPLGTPNPVFLMESAGLYNQNQLIANVNSRLNSNISLFGYYMYNRAMSNTDGLATFPANPYRMAGEYGPASTDIRNRVAVGGSASLPWNVRVSPLFVADTGAPFNITAGRDIWGDTLFNGRPGLTTDPNRPGVIATSYGLLDPNPSPGEEIVPRNFGRGPGSVSLNVRIGKAIAFGPAKEGGSAALSGGGDRRLSGGTFGMGGARGSSVTTNKRYNLTISMSIRNLLNHTNPGPIIGNITSPLFGQANQPAGATSHGGTGFLESANNRRLELQMRFTF
jgi:hypothetical protein